jgi:eukaryotic-like serine/threonine-protein kinase
MASPLPASPKVRFGAFELDPATGKLFKSGIPIKLQPQPFRVLQLLTERPGQVVTREEIQRCLWGDSTFVDFERGINFSINQIRGALSDNAEKPRYVETLPRVGYRFIAALTTDGAGDSAANPAASLQSGKVYDWPNESKTGDAAFTQASGRVEGPRLTPIYISAVILAVLAATVTISLGVRRWHSRNEEVDLQSLRISKVTDIGTVADVAISPDGRYLIYAEGAGERQGLRLRQVATRADVQILPPASGSFHGLTFSPDSNYIYFVRTDPSDLFFKYLYVMPTLGGSTTKLATDVDSPVSFSPDGRKFAYERCVAADNHIDVRIANGDGTGDKLLIAIQNTNCFMYQSGMSWSPDGRVLAIPLMHFGQPERWVLHIVSIADGRGRELYSGPTGLGKPVWLPDGKALLVPRYDRAAHRSQLWTISYPKGEARRLTNDLNDYGVSLDMTRNGDTFVSIADTATSNVWALAEADPTQFRQITSGNLFMFDVAEAPDKRILSISSDGTLWAMDADGDKPYIFAEVHDPEWLTPCGHHVVLVSQGPGFANLMRLDVDGSDATKLASGSFWSPTCSPDGRFVFYVTIDSPQKIWRLSIDGGTPVQIASVLGEDIAGRMSVSPNGEFLAYPYTRYLGPAGPGWDLAVIPIEGGAPLKTFNSRSGSWGIRWSPQGTGLEYALTQSGTTNIWEQPLAGGDPKQITKFSSGRIFDFAWTADGKQLLVTRGEVSSDVVLLANLH